MNEIGVPPWVVELVLNHVSGHRGGVSGTYNKALLAAEKVAALARWDEHLMAAVKKPPTGDDFVEHDPIALTRRELECFRRSG